MQEAFIKSIRHSYIHVQHILNLFPTAFESSLDQKCLLLVFEFAAQKQISICIAGEKGWSSK
jgi:hypothetical protein